MVMASAPIATNGPSPLVRSTSHVQTQFRMTHAALGAFLVLRAEDGGTQICSQMDRLSDDQWVLVLQLPPGQYRYRYYAAHERVTTYVSPSEVEEKPVQMCGLDGILTVPQQRRNMN